MYVGDTKLPVRGVTYGTFAPGEDGQCFPRRDRVEQDFAEMRRVGVNAVRTYTVPPPWLLDAAGHEGLRVMVGIPWEAHIAFLDDGREAAIERTIGTGVRRCAGHPAVLCYTIGNEIPASIVRWHGAPRVEAFLRRLYDAAKREHPDALVTYANYPSTEYLSLPFLDIVSFNVFLEERDEYDAYLARLQHVAGDRPLLITETGLDSRRHGEGAQACAVAWQLELAFAAGGAGAFVFAWTDEWHRGGAHVEDWDFGVTDRRRQPKPALSALARACERTPFPPSRRWPRVSVVVCTYNGARSLARCLAGLHELDYPDLEVIVVDDGSSDGSAELARASGVRTISTENRGLSSARNTGMHAATGEVIAYIDDDAWPDPDWLRHAVTALERGFQAVGGPNLPPEEEGLVAQAVADAPGGPVHVLLSDREAEHIPGCNMAFRRDALLAVDGFDPRFRIAGDDVDLCWRLHERRAAVGFSPGAVVWHLRRGSVRGYLRQQHQYGRAEALLERKWPERYNATGHLTWCGHVYTGGRSRSPWRRWRLYYGRWASEPFPDGGVAPPSLVATLPALPEWYLVIGALAALSLLGIEWRPLLAAVPLLALAVTATVAVAALSPVPTVDRRGRRRALVHQSLVTLLRLLQPAARLTGRLRLGLAPWRGHVTTSRAWPLPATGAIWSERWASQEERLARLQEHLRRDGAVVRAGGGWDRWDLEVRGGVLGAMRLRVGVEEHGEGRQLVRLRSWPRMSAAVIALAVALVALCAGAALSGAPVATVVLATSATALLTGGVLHCTTASGIIRAGLGAEREHSARPRLSVAATRSGGGDGNGRVGHPISTNGATAVRRADAGDRREGEVLS